jgi:hypothetical protein
MAGGRDLVRRHHRARTPQLVSAGLLMLFGVWLRLTERHEHEHEPVTHTHEHWHDLHHAPLSRTHIATLMGGFRHRHTHYPGAHHQHRH